MAVPPSLVASPDLQPLRRALISVSDATGMIELGRALVARGVSIAATGSTCKALNAAGVPAENVADIIGFPEILGGRVKTLHPKIHGGLLGIRNDPVHAAEMAEHGIEGFDLVCVNLYPFEATVAKGADYATAVENIDIGGPAMIRAAAKNHGYAAVVVDPADYGRVLAALEEHDGATPLALRKALAAKAFARTAAYDAAVSSWFAAALDEPAPAWRSFSGALAETLRYGENPHQKAAFYSGGTPRPGVATARQLQGKQLSYNNINDTDAAFELVAEFDAATTPAVAIIKHANPCGVAVGDTLAEAYEKALRCDPVSAFGGIVALNRTLDAAAAKRIVEIFTEVIVAPDATEEAAAIVAAKKNLRLLVTGGLPDPAAPGLTVRSVAGGLLVQDRDFGRTEAGDLKVVTKRAPTAAELADLVFAFRVAKHVKSNAIVYAKDGATVGIGAGQMSRVDSSTIAAKKAAEAARALGRAESLALGSVVASDAFFPFADGLVAAAEAGATAVIQPGGSVRDEEVIAAADAAGLAMVFTGMRHFRH
ncbi:bifunctional phosphoribosylaminoimidazolecarboxamide formyltransferase/IMP cyclohydrolase [Prosthecomicrobium pneumaticum]|uniref:Bifunctional purine biosynthesis protein PurH n=1 Tax=Prosthecomicrobium pneumaticum TaxID=81895 RepID=A0A7W9FMN3_9HYPH|nr:bifunctional phosphoribosylaminoimidazolecarboxamide formyltransferase/IMP cyclohydrolase [Prosthecomicrobium pneumaticum]MBB5753482.1 phosphoribosylaminoimidazolecarboxamide formyltransferase/IMP cyclohydrolase [Prosthecomicrobium pneumaticum]